MICNHKILKRITHWRVKPIVYRCESCKSSFIVELKRLHLHIKPNGALNESFK